METAVRASCVSRPGHRRGDDARAIGYTGMLLDTLPFLTSAIKLYRALGFYDIPPCNDSPPDTTIFLRLDR